jgi:TonB family protein
MTLTACALAVGLLANLFPASVDPVEPGLQNITHLKVKNMPKASPPEPGVCARDGVVVLMVTFDKGARVTDVKVATSSGCQVFDDNAVRAARKISFTPQKENGAAVTITKEISYRFVMRR